MSLVISTTLQPSKILHYIVVAFALMIINVAWYLFFILTLPQPIKIILPVLCICVALKFLHYSYLNSKIFWHIDIGKNATIRCIPSGSNKLSISEQKKLSSSIFHLDENSTIWARVIFLHLKSTSNNKIITIMAVCDTLPADQFRQLSVAIRWIAVRGKSAKALRHFK